MIDIKDLDKAEVLKALYDNSQCLGISGLNAKPGGMDIEEARNILSQGHLYFDYLYGRVMKIDISGDELDPRLYDRDNGEGAAQRAIDGLKGNDSGQNPQESKFRAERCQLKPALILAIKMGRDKSPCDGCNLDRSVCNGGPHKERRM